MPHLLDATMFWASHAGGVRRYLSAKRAWLAEGGRWRHTLVVPRGAGPGVVPCGGLWLPGSGGYQCPLRRHALAGLIERQAPDLIETGDPYRLAWAGLDAARRLRVPAVAFCHSDLPALSAQISSRCGGRVMRWARHAAARYMGHLYGGYDLVLAPSLGLVEQLKACGVKRACHQPLGVDCALFHPGRRDASWRAELGIDPGARVLLFAGRYAPEKHLPLLAGAVALLGRGHVLVTIGDGPAPPHGPRVLRLPLCRHGPALARALASADAFVHAGDQETFGLAALEAMACGTPVILRNAAGLAELARGGTAVTVDSAAPSAWAQAIAATLAAPDENRTARALQRAQAHDWQRVLPQLMQRYEHLLAGLPQRAQPPGAAAPAWQEALRAGGRR